MLSRQKPRVGASGQCAKVGRVAVDVARDVHLFVLSKLRGKVDALHEQCHAVFVGDVERHKLHQTEFVELKAATVSKANN